MGELFGAPSFGKVRGCERRENTSSYPCFPVDIKKKLHLCEQQKLRQREKLSHLHSAARTSAYVGVIMLL